MFKTKLYSTALTIAVTTMSFLPVQATALPEKETTQNSNQRIPMEDVQRFSNAISEIKKYYVIR